MGTEHPSFSSPYTVQTIDQIPTPVLKLLVSLGPLLSHVAQFVQVVMWKSQQPRLSVLLVLGWVALCLWTWQILALGPPALILYKLGHDWLTVRTNRARREKLERVRQEQRKKVDEEEEEARKASEEKELISRKIRPQGYVSLDDTLADLVVINHFLDAFSRQMERGTQVLHETNPLSILSVLMYAAPIWIVLNWWWGPQIVLALVGSLVLISPSPWFAVMMHAMLRNVVFKHLLIAFWAYGVAVVTSVLRFDLQFKDRVRTVFSRAVSTRTKAVKWMEKKEVVQESKGNRSEMIFQFEVFENQRWWLGVHWTTNMMPNERGPWTDSQLKPITNKDDFKLPEGDTKVTYRNVSEKETIKTTIHKTWTWADGDWWVDMTGELQGKVDQNGWEYGNNAWKQPSGVPGLQTFTRRRRWCRRARLVEREMDERIPNDDEIKRKKE
ncbi:hypothetical protein G6F37_000211 [Rhizopus arrhizus]|nr:hypothetical protein G6F38_000577 [Rhizopus arrhizus]KAG1164501.1 hypothetical protein G6F37_000211 [Rhizopus arrhizus]